MTRINFNGKFLSAKPTGVHRVAEELIRAVDELKSETADLEFDLLCPKDATRDLEGVSFPKRVVGHLTWQVWEQFELPRHVDGALLVNLCNLAPLATRRSITMIHDAQTFITPQSYSRPFRAWYQFALPVIGRRHGRVLTVSEYSRQELVKAGVASAEKIHVIHNGVDHVLRHTSDGAIVQKLGLDQGKFAVALSNTQAHKNIEVAINAFSRPELSQYKLVLFGGSGPDDFKSAGIELPSNVIFSGFLSDEELTGLVSSAGVMVFPSLTEGFGLPPLEAMMLGTPAICAPCGAVPEVCGEAATYAEPHDVEAWTKAIVQHLRSDDEFRAQQAERVKAHASAFTWRKAGQELIRQIRGEIRELDG